ncbi:T9SS type A sorting domain-containing protein [Psychroserpens sp. AS72]|uniref:T9SS type A sorting domain-containing protein n=1 Tax=Psychroserpens sp. AS72 TaxID=3135775 RepID=UPI00318017C6
MSNFTRSGGRAKIWQSITNLSCCSIDLFTKRNFSMKAMAFFMLFAFSVSSMIAQQSARSTFISGCLSDAPNGFSEGEVALLYANECGDLTPEVVITVLQDGNDCDWTKEITYDIKCGDFEEQFKIDYFGGDNTPPTLNEGAEVPGGGQNLNLCFDNVPVGPTAASIAALYTDNCSEVIVTKSGTPSGGNCEWSVDYIYSIVDGCGNMASDLIVSYNGGDSQAPYLNKGATIPTGETGLNLCFSDKAQGPTVEDIAALFSDNCGNVIVEKQSVSKGTDCKWMAEYTYTIKDDCNNFAESIVLQYYGGDLENPELSGVPGDITVDCVDEIPSPGSKTIFASDNCASKVSVSSSDDTSGLGDACEGGVIIRTYTATDDCGRSVSETQTITVLPAPESTIVAPELPTNISCEEVAAFLAPDATYSNGVSQGACSINGSIEGEVSAQYTGCGGEITITYNGVDSCGRTLSAGPYVITVDPAPAATFDNIVGDDLTCEEANAFVPEPLSYSNGALNEACLIAGSVEGVIIDQSTICGGAFYVDYIFTDDCDRTITKKVTYTVKPAPPATFDEVEDMTISCDEAGSFTAGSLGYTNGSSSEACLISGSVDGELSGSYTECGGTLTVNWTYTDECDRTIEASQTITVEPAPMAVFDEVEDMTISCDEAGSYTASSLGYTNGASNEACLISGSVPGELSGSYTECGGTLTVNWTYTDECERTIEASQTITVEPAPIAMFDEVEEITISCEEAGSFTAGSLGYSNEASNEACLISGSVPGELSGSYTECGGTLTVNWTYTDECQRTIEASQTITVEPAPMAAFDEVEDMTISCDEAGSFTAGSLGYTNGASSEACLISGSVDGELSGSYTECGGTLYVDWTYTDDCDRTITAKKTITVEPAPMAAFDEVENMTISCEEAGSFTAGSLGYTNGASSEACLISGTVPGELSGSYTECGGTLTVNWTYTDECQRTIEASQTITVEPAPMAAFDDVEDMTISCDEAGSFTAGSLGYTNGASNEACLISGSVPGELSGSYTECGGTLTVNWTYTDECERTIEASQTITVEPAPMAAFDEVENMTISCEEAGLFKADSLAYTNGASNEACLISGTVPGELSGSYTECGGTLYVDWTYTDDCDRTITAKKEITVEPAPMAAFDEVEDMTISCDEAGLFAAGSLGYTNGALNEACLISGSVDGELSGSYTECGGTLTVNWTYTDECQRTIEASQTITVEPAPMAAFDEVENITISCDEAGSFVAGSLSYTNGASNEACLISGSVDGELSGEYTECGGLLFVDWTYTDDCERTITARQQIKVNPAPMAAFDEVEDMTISCEEAGSFTAGSLGYTNGASNEACLISGSVDGELSGSYTECGGTLTVNWTYTDDCQRTIEASQTITVEPAPMATFDEVEDMTISCEEANSFVAGSLSYTNGASTEACLISGSVDGELSGSYTECGGTLTVNWTYTDECERTIEASQTITVEPAPMAVFDEVENMTISCDEAGSFVAGSLAYTNGGTGACLISGSVDGELSGSYTECGGTLYVDWTYTDDCDRTITAKKEITVEPAPMATFDQVENMTISCEEANSFEADSLGYTNGASNEACLISGSVPGELSGSYTECGGTLTVNWTYTDDCQRTIEASQTITVEPAPMAAFDEVENMTISCDEAGSFTAGSLAYTNGGTGVCEISGSVDGELSGSYTECGGTLFVDWTYTDDCDRTITAKKEITVEPAPMAAFDDVEDMTISCEEANSFAAGSLGYTNGASSEACLISGSVDGELSGSYTECGGTLTVNWTYTDECERTIEASQTITVEPAPMAAFDEVENMTISCEEAGSFEAGSLAYTNGGTGACEISGSVLGELSGSYTECGGTLTVDWTYTDDCDRTITAKKEITVEPAPMAVFNDVQDITIACYLASQYEVGSLGYTNEASNEACLIEGSVPGELSGSYTECGGTLYVDWTYTDDCDRTITARKTITVSPAPMAVFDDVEDMTISCDEAGSFTAGSLGYTNGSSSEACLISGSVDGELSGSYTECGGTLTVNWTYTDECERTIEASQTITVEPAPMAAFDEVVNMTISCEEAGLFKADSLGYTNGASNEACLIEGSVPGELSGSYTECGGTLYVDWTYTDDCDRTITAKKEITVEPAPMAAFDDVEDMTISCEEAGSFTAGSLGYTNGASNEACLISGLVPGELSGSYTECGGTLTVNWTYTDDCERTIEASQTITVEPAPMAAFDEVENITISCDEAGSFVAGSLGYTNGASNEACLISGSVDGELSGEYTECGGLLFVDWTYTDDCERTITARQQIKVNPAPMAAFDDVEDMTISCEEANSFVAGSLGYTNGASNEACLISGSVDGELSGSYTECGGTLTVNWTYTDDCDRTIEASQTITVEAAPMAAFDDVENMTISCEEANSFEAGSLAYTNGGTGVCEISGSVPGELSGSYTECGGTLYVDWTYTDDCDRTITAKKEITVEPAPMAAFDDVEDMTISCEEANSFVASSLGYTNGGTGVCEISGSVDGEATPDYTECGGTITVNWTYTDDCQRTIEASQTITVEPAPMAAFDDVENMTISCEEANSFEAGSLAYTNGGTGVCEISGSVPGELSGSYTECGGTLYLDWTYTDDCDRTITAKKEITVEPAPMAAFDDVEDMTISCEEANSFVASSLGYTNGGTGVCEISGSVDGEATPDYTECGGTITVNWTYTDDCQRTIEASQTITVEPAPMAAFDDVENMTISCEEANSFEAGSLGYTNGGTGACEISGSVPGELSGSYTECGGTLYVDWTYTDDCDRTITAKKEITVEPAPMAAFDDVEGMTISCEEANSFVASSLGYTNGGTGACEISGSVDGEATPNYTECGGTITVNWTYTDDCDRTIEASQTITVEPAPMAAFDDIEDATIACEDLASYEAEFLSYTNGGTEACLIAGSVQGEAQAFEGSCGTFEVDFTFTDDCGRTITAKQLVTVIDETAPVLVGELPMGESDVNACFADAPEGPSIEEVAALFTDNCGNVNVTKTVFSPAENTDCLWAVVIRYDVQDDCGNYATPVKIAYNGGDASAPVLEGELPEGTTGLQCLSENPGAPEAGAIKALYTDNCGEVIVTALEPSIEGDDCEWTATYTFKVKDSCGNFADDVVIVNSGADTMAPVLVGETPPIVVNSINACKDGDLGEPSAEDIAALYTDNCSVVSVVKVEKLSIGSDCEWIKVFEYTAKDVCGNMAELIKITYSGGDDTAPQPTGTCDNEVMTIGTEMGATCPADASISLEIGDEITAGDNSWSVAGLTIADMNGTLVPCFTDNCADVSELTYRVTDKGVTGDDCSKTLTITFEVEDNCENISEPFTCTFIIVDDTAPVIECPEGQDYGVVTETPSGFADKAPWADNCQGSGLTTDYSDNLTSVINEGGSTNGITFDCLFLGSPFIINFEASTGTDENGYNLYDNVQPQTATYSLIFNAINNRWELQNVGSQIIAVSNVATFAPSCDIADWTDINPDCETLDISCESSTTTEDFTLVRTFTANDGCGNTATCDVTYTWSIEENTDIACGDVVNGNTDDSDVNTGLPYCGTSLSDRQGNFYTFIGTGDLVTVSTCSANTTYDTKLGVFTDEAATCVTGDDDTTNATNCTHSSLHSQVEFVSVIGQEYQVYVTGYSGYTGDYELSVTCEEACDEVAPVLECPEGQDFGIVQVAPTAFATSAPYTDEGNAGGQTQVFTDSDIAVTTGDFVQTGTEFRFIFEEGYILTFGEGPDYSSGYVTDYSGNYLEGYGSFEMVYNFQFEDYDILQNGESVGYGGASGINPPSCDDFWHFISEDGHNKAFTVECAQFSSSTNYSFTRTFYAEDDCGNVGECSVEYTWSTESNGSARQDTTRDEDFAFTVGSRDVVANEDVKIDFTAYPVPFDNEVNIAYSFEFDTDVTIELFDTKGLQVFSTTNKNYVAGSKDKTTFDLSRYSSQMFYVTLTTSQGKVTKKIVASGKK